jgi:hypothetical protein
MDPLTFKCPKCDYTNSSLNSLRIHFQKVHKGSSKDLRIALFHDGVQPTCECGCDELTEFDTLQLGFKRFVNGHNSRVFNPWGHNPVAQAKSKATQREMWKNGEMTKWRLGLSPEDPRNKALIEKMTQTINANQEELARRAETMRKNRLDGTIPTLSGEDHPQWKGGTSSISVRCHASSRLFKEWKYPKLHVSGFACQRCGSTNRLQVHHDGERMADIIHRFVDEINPQHIDDWDLSTRVAEAVVEYHIQNNVSGEVICWECHKKEHPKLNFR